MCLPIDDDLITLNFVDYQVGNSTACLWLGIYDVWITYNIIEDCN